MHASERSALKDQVFLRMALEISRLGTCCRLRVGCILLRPDGGIASGGFNGALPGMPHCTPETCGPDKRCLHTSHAEENALGFSEGPVAIAYITDEPCLTCTRALVRRGVRRVVFLRSGGVVRAVVGLGPVPARARGPAVRRPSRLARLARLASISRSFSVLEVARRHDA